MACPGCVVKVYQPLAGLQGPVVVDPQFPNFTDTSLELHCLRGKLLTDSETNALCDKVTTLFENQGAQVRATVGGSSIDGLEPPQATGTRTELSVELRARETDESKHPFSWLLFLGSFTVLPGIMEQSFAQDVVIRDESGFLLVSSTLEGRLVQRHGVGPWFGNKLLDLTRKKDDKLGKDAAHRDLSADLYAHLSQVVFNAKMHAQVLRHAPPLGSSE